ncbi:hypothetical protein B0181_00625 [Moraxella caviae]|uniref:D-malate degradation protein R n=2 Tax=Moraxella caviae TaxID=34060 RepID=A0A1T0AC08_9GAMM|nr:hypothetical protein B0181_00625 [Moraxella caviae]STZ10452.1 D-malate degradation protein R [Moraxella caviae]
MTLSEHINAKNLELFLQVYEQGSFSAVARRQNVSPSLISRTVYQLEEAVGQALFYRSTRSISPTESGQLFARYAQETLHTLKEMQTQMQSLKGEVGGVVRINSAVIFAQKHIAPYLAALNERYPKLQIELVQTDSLADPQQFDLTFRIGPLNDNNLRTKIIGEHRTYCVCSPAYADRYGKPANLAELARHQCLFYKGTNGIVHWFAKQQDDWQQLNLPVKLTANNAETLLQSARDGLGIALLPNWMIYQDIQTGSLVPLLSGHTLNERIDRQYILAVYPNHRHTPTNVRAVLDFLSEIYGHTAYWEI